MLIDDHAGFRRFLHRCLAHYPFIEVVGEARSAEEAWAAIPRLLPDLLTVDIHLPGRNGFEFARKVRDRYPGIDVVFISFTGNQSFRKTAGEMSCPYLTKENLLEDLDPVLEALRNCLRLAGEDENCEDDKNQGTNNTVGDTVG